MTFGQKLSALYRRREKRKSRALGHSHLWSGPVPDEILDKYFPPERMR
jgi:hypothetical protein